MTAEIFARCGAPDYVYTGLPQNHYAHHYGSYYGHVQLGGFTRWIYAGQGDVLDRELLFQQGQLIEIRALFR